jgi:hypothetical protein
VLAVSKAAQYAVCQPGFVSGVSKSLCFCSCVSISRGSRTSPSLLRRAREADWRESVLPLHESAPPRQKPVTQNQHQKELL